MYSVLVFMIALSAVWYFLSALGCFSFTTTIVVGFFAFVWNDCFFYFPLFRKPFLEFLSWTCSWNLKSWSLLDCITSSSLSDSITMVSRLSRNSSWRTSSRRYMTFDQKWVSLLTNLVGGRSISFRHWSNNGFNYFETCMELYDI